MSRRAAPPNRETLELALNAASLADLKRMVARFGIRPDRWHTLTMFRCFVIDAVLHLADDLTRNGLGWNDAVMTAASRCGVSPDSFRTWLRRARLDRVHHEHPERHSVPFDLSQQRNRRRA